MQFNRNWPAKVIHCMLDSNHSRGVRILFGMGFPCAVIRIHLSEQDRLINLDINGKGITVVCAYPLNDISRRIVFLKKLKKLSIAKVMSQ